MLHTRLLVLLALAAALLQSGCTSDPPRPAAPRTDAGAAASTSAAPMATDATTTDATAPAGDDAPSVTAPGSRRLEYLHEPVAEVLPQDHGTVHVGFTRSARWYVIDPARSPDAAALVAAAEAALASGQPVHVTIDATGTPTTKAPPRAGAASAPFPAILRLADTPDAACPPR